MSARVINAQISKYGESVTVMPRQAISDEDTGSAYGNVEFSYPEHLWFKCRAMIYDASGMRDAWYVIGYQVLADYVASFSSAYQGKINPNDVVELADGTMTLVDTVITRGRGQQKDFMEVILRRSRR